MFRLENAKGKTYKVFLKEKLNNTKQKAEKHARDHCKPESKLLTNKEFTKLKEDVHSGKVLREDFYEKDRTHFDLLKHSKRKKNKKDILELLQRQKLHRRQRSKSKKVNLENMTPQVRPKSIKFDPSKKSIKMLRSVRKERNDMRASYKKMGRQARDYY